MGGDGGGARPLQAELAARVARRGPLPFEEVVELALYQPEHGFYDGGGGAAGRAGDFLTSPEVGPLFGVVVGRALDAWWDELGRPDPFTVVEAGAGPGTLAVAVRAARPACAPALTWVLVDRSAAQRARQAERLPLVEPWLALPPGPDEDGRPGPEAGTGPRFTALAELPSQRVRGVVLANELLDNLPFGLLERTGDGWAEVRVTLDGDAPVEHLVPALPADADLAGRLASAATAGARIPVQHRAARWVGDALAVLEAGRLVVLDYGRPTAELAARPWHEWVRTYRGHDRGVHPLDALGAQDVTCEVAVDQLARTRAPDVVERQADLLRRHGIEDLVEEGRRAWEERAHVGDLAAVAARSRIREADALLDEDGLGAFLALQWLVGVDGLAGGRR